MSSDLVLAPQEYLYFVERAVRGMEAIVVELGEERACEPADVPGANSAYGLLTHCLGVMEYWGGRIVAGRSVVRDREAEFMAVGSVAELSSRVDAALVRLQHDLEALEPTAPVRVQPDAWAQGPDLALTQSAALQHLYEELAQHHGQMEVLRDVVKASGPSGFEDLPMPWLRAKHGVKWRRPGPDLLPAWVADMDFPLAPPIRTAIADVVSRADLTYADWSGHPLAEPFAERMASRYGWVPDPSHVRGVNDLIQALQIVLTLATDPGDGVICHTPNYPPFLASVSSTGRRLVPSPLVPTGDSWTWDHAALDAAAAGARVLLLVNPHNPTGRVFTRDELSSILDLAERHDLLVVSDEIHAELVHAPFSHVPFASLSAAAAARTVTVTSAGKAFNLAGVRTAIAHVGAAWLRQRWDAQPVDLFGGPNVIGVEATLAAWRSGDSWLQDLNAHLLRQRDRVVARVSSWPGVSVRVPEAGYLAWLDFSGSGLPDDPAAWLGENASVYLSPGPDFGPEGVGFARLNFATSSAVLEEILDRIETALRAR